jgi:hypothetical protein
MEVVLEQLTTIELAKEYLKFSAAHFTIFRNRTRTPAWPQFQGRSA